MKKKNNTEQQFENLQDGLNQSVNTTEEFIKKNQLLLISFLVAIILIFVGTSLWENQYKLPKTQEAQTQLFQAEQYFEKDSFSLALNGTEEFQGFIEISEKYANTTPGQLATYYAGICYLRIGEYQNSIKMLDKYQTDDKLLLSIAQINIGDAFSELNQPKEAIEYYKKGISTHTNELTTPIALMKCANLYESQEDYNNAIECYETIQIKYPESTLAQNIEKYINKISNK